MKRLHTLLTCAVALGLVGCTVRTLPITPVGSAPAGGSKIERPGDVTVAPPQDEYGSLALEIAWPERPAYATQVIPTSTNALIVTLRSAGTSGTILAQRTIARQAGQTTASETFQLKAANNLSLEVQAYKESAPDYATSQPTARGTANFNIVRSQESSVNLVLQGLNAPIIKSLSTNLGLPGNTLTITGDKFGGEGDPLPTVKFGGVAAPGVTRTSSASLTVTVPAEALTGALVVETDGVPNASTFGNQWSFWIPKSLTVTTGLKPSWDTGTPADARAVLFGTTRDFTVQPTWVQGASLGLFGNAPQPTWSCDNPAAGTISTTGRFTAGSTYATGVISAKYDNGQSSVASSNTLTVVSEDVNVTLEAPAGKLGGKGQASLQLRAFNTLSDGATNSLVTYSAQAGVGVSSSGVATADLTINGSAVVTATSQLITTRKATASVAVANYVVSTFAGHGGGNSYGNLDGDALTYAQFNYPSAIAVDPASSVVFVADYGGRTLRRIADGQVTTLPIGYSWLDIDALAYDPASKTLYGSDTYYDRLYRIALNETATAVASWSILAGDPGENYQTGNAGGYLNGVGTAARFYNPGGLAYDPVRALLYVADTSNHVIRKVDAAGSVSLHAGKPLTAGSVDGTGNAAQFNNPGGLAIDPDGNLYVTESGKIRKVTPDGVVTTLPGTLFGGSLVRDASGNFYTNTGMNVLYRMTPDGVASVVAGKTRSSYDPRLSGGPIIVDGVGTKAEFNDIRQLAIDSQGRLYAVEQYNNVVRLIE